MILDGYNVTVSKDGEITNLKTGKILKATKCRDGYHRINLKQDNGKRVGVSVHRAVAMTYLPNPLDLPEVNHIDGDKSNNSLSNLEWCSRSENMKHAHKKKLLTGRKKSPSAQKKYQCLLDLYATGKYTHADLEEVFEISRPMVSYGIKQAKHFRETGEYLTIPSEYRSSNDSTL